MIGLLPRGTAYLLIFAMLVFAGIQYVPVYLNAWMFYDGVRQEVRFAGSKRRTVETVRESIFRLAEQYVAPDPDEEVEVDVSQDGPFFVVGVRYSVPVDMRIYQHEIDFDWDFSGEAVSE